MALVSSCRWLRFALTYDTVECSKALQQIIQSCIKKKENSGFSNISFAFSFLYRTSLVLRGEGGCTPTRCHVVEYKGTLIKSTTNMKCVHMALMLKVAHCAKSKK